MGVYFDRKNKSGANILKSAQEKSDKKYLDLRSLDLIVKSKKSLVKKS